MATDTLGGGTDVFNSRQNQIGKLLLRLQPNTIADRTLEVFQNGLPQAFYVDYARRLNAVTLAEVQAAANKYLDPDHLTIAVVGDRAKLEGQLRATGIPVVIVP